MVKSPSLNGYFRLQPWAPNLILPEIKEWKKHRLSKHVALHMKTDTTQPHMTIHSKGRTEHT